MEDSNSTDIEVTAEMIKVGNEALESFIIEGGILRLEYEDAVKAIFLSMRRSQVVCKSHACGSLRVSKPLVNP